MDDDDNEDDDEGITMEVPQSRRFSDAKPKSVIEGGTEAGWSPLSSVVLWKRMLGIMGNINDIKDSQIHGCVFKHLIEIWLMLENVSFSNLHCYPELESGNIFQCRCYKLMLFRFVTQRC